LNRLRHVVGIQPDGHIVKLIWTDTQDQRFYRLLQRVKMEIFDPTNNRPGIKKLPSELLANRFIRIVRSRWTWR
jgi:hypothetical protein